MDLELSAEQEALRDTLRRFLAERAPLSYVRDIYPETSGSTDEVWKGLVELGLTGLLVPEEFGGAGMGMVEMGIVLQEMGRMVHPGPFLSSAVAATSALLSVGDDDDRARLLPSLADGSLRATLALLEPHSRSRWQLPSTSARRAGSGWKVTGTKRPVPDGGAAELLLVAASADDGIALVAVEADAPGVELMPAPTVDGSRKQSTLVLRDAPARRVGAKDAARPLAVVVDRLLAAYAADGLGAAERAMEMAVEYAKERVQFERPIGSFQAVQHLCAEMLKAVELARAGVGYALWTLDAADTTEAHRAATMAKAFCAEYLPAVGTNAVQVFGGVGFTWEHDIHLYYKRLLTLQQVHGPPSDHLEELASIIV